MHARRFLWAPLAASLALAACGGGDAPSKDEFASSANDICKDLENATNKLETGNPDSAEEIKTLIDDLKKTLDDGVQRIEDLEVPEGEDGEKAEQWQDAISKNADQATKALDDASEAADKNDLPGVQKAFEEIGKIDEKEVDRLAREVGATSCAE